MLIKFDIPFLLSYRQTDLEYPNGNITPPIDRDTLTNRREKSSHEFVNFASDVYLHFTPICKMG